VFKEKQKSGSYFIRDVEIRQSPIHGLGVFATKDLPEHHCVEVSPTIAFGRGILRDYLYQNESRHILHDYVFTHRDGVVLVGLGWSSIYNHNHEPNAFWKYESTGKDTYSIQVYTKRAISCGEEILIRYSPDSGILWFDDGYVNRKLSEG
jgi:hypothetical protein